ncbi:MAG: AAA family ATPase [Actinomycetota bacterium]
MITTSLDIVAREAELEAVAGLIDQTGDWPRALLLEGEPGIGKTTLWQWGVDRARARDDVVLTCRSSETEGALPFAALGDVLEPILAEPPRSLSARQQVALGTALARIEPRETLERLAVARATHALIKEVALQAPVVIAIDDAQWLDPPSAEALEFVLRRLDTLPVRILVTRRGAEDAVPLGLDRAVRAEWFSKMWLDPFSVGELDQLLRGRIGLTLSRPRLIELQRITGGNPFYALEVGRASVRRGGGSQGGLTVPDSLGELIRERLLQLSPEGRDAVLLAAATSHPGSALVERAASGNAGLGEAVREGMLESDGDRLVFAHPLLASVAYDSATPWDRREAHRRLAPASSDPLERARHLALSTEDNDEAVAAELEAAALHAHRLGAVAAAAEIADHACRLTPAADTDAVVTRIARSAEYHLAGGDSARGRALLEEVIARLPAGPERAASLLLLGRVHTVGEDLVAARELSAQALAEAGPDVRLTAAAEHALGSLAIGSGDIPGALAHSHSALELAEHADDAGVLALALGGVVLIEFLLGMGFDGDRMERAIELEGSIADVPVEWLPSYARAGIALFTDDLETARSVYGGLHDLALARSDERALCLVLFPLSQVESAAGNWTLARRHADEAVERSRQGGLGTVHANSLYTQALVGALLGREDAARTSAAEGLEIAAKSGAVAPMTWLTAALGFLELSLGDHEATHRTLGPLSEMIVNMGLGEPGVVRFLPDEIEALVALGELDQARPLTSMLEERGAALDRPWARATGARSAALVAAAEGDFDAARVAIVRALAAHERLNQPFELGRTRLVEGTIERRSKRRAVARRALTEAIEIFDALGAPLWAAKAAAELARIPGRGPGSGELTPTERKVAELVASGLSNTEVAAKLFVTVRTVEWNLSKVYAKLGARSRTELAGRLAQEDDS